MDIDDPLDRARLIISVCTIIAYVLIVFALLYAPVKPAVQSCQQTPTPYVLE